MTIDYRVLDWVVGHRTDWATAVARALMVVGTRRVPAVIAVLLACVVLGALRWWRPAAAALLAVVAAVVVTEVGKLLLQRPRPPADLALVHAGGFAMPSTDGAVTAAAATVLAAAAVATGRRAGALLAGALLAGALLAGTVVVGVALVYLGAHWASDVLAGWLVGAALGGAATRLLVRARS